MNKKKFIVIVSIIMLFVAGLTACVGSKHTHSFVLLRAEQKYLCSKATCTKQASYYYSCECGEKGTETFDYGSLGHSFTNYVIDKKATCTEDETKIAKCDYCNETDTITIKGSKLGHSFTNYIPDESGVSVAHCIHAGCLAVGIAIDDGVTSISSNAFRNRKDITCVIIPNSVTSIGQYAFYCCSGLESVVMSDRLISIGAFAFSGCATLANISIPNSVTSIGTNAFNGCHSLTNIMIPSSVTSIDNDAFIYCSGLITIEVSAENSVYSSAGNCLIENKSGALILGCKNSAIPKDGRVKRIADCAFLGCYGLKNIAIPSSVGNIGQYAFGNCLELEHVIINEGVAWLSVSAFNGCAKLVDIIIPSSTETIASGAFTGCVELKNVFYNGTVTQWDEVDISFHNEYLNAATLYFYTESEPIVNGNYWHFDIDAQTPLIWKKSD